jgi:hypothetical protein
MADRPRIPVKKQKYVETPYGGRTREARQSAETYNHARGTLGKPSVMGNMIGEGMRGMILGGLQRGLDAMDDHNGR